MCIRDRFKIRRDPANEITWENRDQIKVVELTDQCMPAPLEAPVASVATSNGCLLYTSRCV